MTKLIVIVGITGNQGGSVAQTFLQDPSWRIRGLSRDISSPASQALTSNGVEMVTANLHDPNSLQNVFKGANLVFSVTDFWVPYLDPANHARAKELGKSIGRYAYELELEQGKNIVDAVAREVKGLDDVGFVASTLSSAKKFSKGKYQELWHFDSKADVFPDYVEEKYPELAKKTSYLHTGYFFTSWKYLPDQWFAKMPHGEIQMRFPTSPGTIIPHLDPRKDVGPFVQALLQLPPNSTLMAAGTWCTWPEWIQKWGQILGINTSYKQVTLADFEKWMPGGLGQELGDMFEFSIELFDRGDPNVLKATDLEKKGIQISKTSLEEYIRNEDWKAAGVLPT